MPTALPSGAAKKDSIILAKHDKPVFIAAGGLDPSAGAGLAADITAGLRNGATCLPVATSLTVQDYRAAYASYAVDTEIIKEQLETLWEYYQPAILKVGLAGSPENAAVIADFVERHGVKLVLDPVTVSSSGFALAGEETEAAIRDLLVPAAYLVTPNAREAGLLAEMDIQTPEQAKSAAIVICDLGADNVWITGGHLDTPGRIIDTLYNGDVFEVFKSGRQEGGARGTGCAAASAAAARLALGEDVSTSVAAARDYAANIIGGK